MSDRRATYADARAVYSDEFEKALTEEIFNAVVETSRCTDANLVALRTSESIEALLKTLALILALTPYARSPTRLREAVEELAKRLRRLTREALDDPTFRDSAARVFRGDDFRGACMSTARRIAEALTAKPIKSRGGCLVPCLAHQDANQSLSLRDGQRGILVHCFAGCAPADILDALRRRRLIEPRQAPHDRNADHSTSGMKQSTPTARRSSAISPSAA
jgi:hypothetical protein